MNAQQIVEAVLFASDAPLTASEIARADESLDEDQVEQVLQQLRAEYDDAGRAFQIVELAEGHQILTRPEFAPYLERFDNVPRASRLSGPALETLAIIAYRQPIGRLEIEYIRGVTAAGVIRTLQERNLIDVVGRAEGLGRPLLYGTTRHFLEHFGFRSLENLPRPEELPIILRERIPLGVEELPSTVDGDGEPAAEAASAVGDMVLTGAAGPDSATHEAAADELLAETDDAAEGAAGGRDAESRDDWRAALEVEDLADDGLPDGPVEPTRDLLEGASEPER